MAASGSSAKRIVVFVASIIALNAFGIDNILPAMPTMGYRFCVAQIKWGPLADR